MMRNRRIRWAATAVFGALVLAGLSVAAQPQAQEPPPMGFFVTSVGVGDGANLGGLEGADAHCQTLAAGVGAGDRHLAGLPEPRRAPEPSTHAIGSGKDRGRTRRAS